MLGLVQPSRPLQFDAVSSSEAASLKGHKALTPIIAGSVCGGLLGVAWIVGFVIYFIKRRKRKQRQAIEAAGWTLPRKKKTPEKPAERIIIPPDPAVILGHRRPGEHAFLDDRRSTDHDPSLPTMPLKPLATQRFANLIQADQPSYSTPMTAAHDGSP